MDDLPTTFNLTRPAGEMQPPGRVFGDEILEQIQEFFAKWSDRVEPPLLVALAVLYGTDMYGALGQVNDGINWIKNDGIASITTPIKAGHRPDTAPLTAKWREILGRRDEHLKLARRHFSLTRETLRETCDETRFRTRRTDGRDIRNDRRTEAPPPAEAPRATGSRRAGSCRERLRQ
jgi:hypothetical protein